MKLLYSVTIVISAVSTQAQFSGGSGMAGGGLSGVGGGSFGGAIIARVNVTPYGGGGGFQGGGMGLQGGGAGGLFGVTRPTFMAEPNTSAAQFFSMGGVRLPVRDVTGGATTGGGGGMYLGAQAQPQRSTAGLPAATQLADSDQAAEPPAPAMPFAPPPATSGNSATQARLNGVAPVAAAQPASAWVVRRLPRDPQSIGQNPVPDAGRTPPIPGSQPTPFGRQ